MKSSIRVFNRSNKCACGKLATICAFDTGGSHDAGDQELLELFCADCAKSGIQKVQTSSWLHITESRSPQASADSVRRNYKVHSLNESANRADLVIVGGSNQFLCGLKITIRLDAIPANRRVLDATFQIAGTPLEIELFEHSVKQ